MSTEEMMGRFRRVLNECSSDMVLTETIDYIADKLVHEVLIQEYQGQEEPENSRAGSDGQTEHYGSADDPYEAIKIIEHYGLGFHLGNAIKYILRSDKTGKQKRDLEKAAWYVNRFVTNVLGRKS